MQIERERVVSLENHPADSRVDIRADDTVQTLTSRMGTGGGNVPLVLTYEEADEPTERERERAIGADMQNGLLTGNHSMTVLASRSDPHSVPCVLVLKERCE